MGFSTEQKARGPKPSVLGGSLWRKKPRSWPGDKNVGQSVSDQGFGGEEQFRKC